MPQRVLRRPSGPGFCSCARFSISATQAVLLPEPIGPRIEGRVGRFPPMADGGPTWSGVFLDGMPPDTDHWLYTLAEEVQPEGYAFFAQPAGDGPEAENRHHLPADYYDRIKAGKDADWVKVYV